MYVIVSDPTSIPLLKAADFWLGAIGFLITFATFGLGWRKLIKVQKAADDAKEQVAEFKETLRKYDATGAVSLAVYAVKSAQRSVDVQDWRGVSAVLTEIRHAAVELQPIIIDLDSELSAKLERIKISIDRTITRLDEAPPAQKANATSGVIKLMRNTHDTMRSIDRLLRDKM